MDGRSSPEVTSHTYGADPYGCAISLWNAPGLGRPCRRPSFSWPVVLWLDCQICVSQELAGASDGVPGVTNGLLPPLFRGWLINGHDGAPQLCRRERTSLSATSAYGIRIRPVMAPQCALAAQKSNQGAFRPPLWLLRRDPVVRIDLVVSKKLLGLSDGPPADLDQEARMGNGLSRAPGGGSCRLKPHLTSTKGVTHELSNLAAVYAACRDTSFTFATTGNLGWIRKAPLWPMTIPPAQRPSCQRVSSCEMESSRFGTGSGAVTRSKTSRAGS
jgi:hypothetical protein